MSSWRSSIAVVLLLVLAPPALAQGGRGGSQRTPVRDQQREAAIGSGTLSGRVSSTEGTPLRRAQVQLTSRDGRLRKGTTTDYDGRFTLSELPAGTYTLRADKAGFVGFAFGQRAFGETVPPIILGDGESLSGLNLVLPRGSAITGRVTDEFGDPVLQVQVQALRYQFRPDGQRQLVQSSGPAMTDDLGQFRLYGLTPGDYVVSATTRNAGPMPRRGQADESEEGYPPTFYPGTINPAEAQPVSVGLGQEMSVHLQLVPSRLSRVSGVVVDSQGRPAGRGTAVILRPATNIGPASIRSANIGDEGAFILPGVPPGDYVIEVRPRPMPRAQANQAPPQEFAVVPIAVGGGDVAGVRIVTGRGATLSGRVVFEGTPPAAGTRVRVVPQSADPSREAQMLRNGGNDGVVAADGSFQVDGVTGPAFLRITIEGGRGGAPPEPLRYMTKSVLVDGVDVADVPIDPGRLGSISGITVVITDRLTDISGVVTDGRGTPLQSTTVLIVPELLPAGVSPTRFVRVLQSDDDGHFNVRGMPAGRYVAAAVTALEAGHQYDPDVIQRARQSGRSFAVREGESVNVDLRATGDF